MGGDDEVTGRRSVARENADYHVAAQRRREEQESVKAAALLADFVRSAEAAGIPTTELTAQPGNGRGRYRTGVTGWFLRPDRTLGVGTDGSWYVLVVPASLRARLRGFDLESSAPPLQVGAGGRDGESVTMPRLLAIRLEAGRDHP